MSSLSGKSTLQCLVNSPHLIFTDCSCECFKTVLFVDALVKKTRAFVSGKFHKRLNQLATLVEHLIVPKSMVVSKPYRQM
jgi:hypothetical protein